MQTRRRLTGWAVLLVVLGQGVLGAGRAAAQGPAAPSEGGPPAAHRIPTHNRKFKLPVQIEDRDRANLQSIQLFVKQGGGDWQLKETAPPSQTCFTYEATQDGEYAFSVVTVDKAGQPNPPDVRREPPALVVLVDTQPPTLEVQPATGPGGEPVLRCDIKDANPDYASLKASWRGPDQQWHALEPLPGARGVFRVPGPEVLKGTVQVSACDLAKNVCRREINLGDAQARQGGPDLPTPRPIGGLAMDAAPLPPAPPQAARAVASPDNVAPRSAPPAVPPAAVQQAAIPAAPVGPSGIERTSFSAPAAAAPGSPARQILNTTRALVDYRLDQVGPSGVGRVEVYITSDEGKTWQRLCEDRDRRSPAELALPGEGLFGVRLVVTNGNGFGGTAPRPGDTPTCWIEVDQTAPHCQLHEVDPVVHDGALEIRWSASDRNLGAEPVSLYYAAKKEGPWLPVARGLRNDGVYRWTFPRDVGGQFFLRLEVVDQAGNVGRCEPSTPVVLDMTEPRALVVGISPAGPRP